MKAAAFGLVRAESVDEVLAALAEFGDEARVIAGGQSLGPLMALRLAAPEVLVDLSRVPGLDTLSVAGGRTATPGPAGQGPVGGSVRVGAMVRQRTVEHSGDVRAAAPLVAEAVPHIGHTAIRSQGTVCGSLAHADPAAELPAVAVAAGATMHLRSPSGVRTVAAPDFFTGYYATVIEPGEILEAVEFPAPAPRTGTAFVEFSRRHGDFALVGVAATVSLAADGTISAANIALSGVASTPWAATAAIDLLVAATPQPSVVPTNEPAPPSGRESAASTQVDAARLRPAAGEAAGLSARPPSGRESAASTQVDAARLRPEAGEAGGLSARPPSGRRPGAANQVDASRLRPEAGPYADVVQAAAEAVRAAVDPGGDLHATAAYRRHLAGVLTARALTTALARAGENLR